MKKIKLNPPAIAYQYLAKALKKEGLTWRDAQKTASIEIKKLTEEAIKKDLGTKGDKKKGRGAEEDKNANLPTGILLKLLKDPPFDVEIPGTNFIRRSKTWPPKIKYTQKNEALYPKSGQIIFLQSYNHFAFFREAYFIVSIEGGSTFFRKWDFKKEKWDSMEGEASWKWKNRVESSFNQSIHFIMPTLEKVKELFGITFTDDEFTSLVKEIKKFIEDSKAEETNFFKYDFETLTSYKNFFIEILCHPFWEWKWDSASKGMNLFMSDVYKFVLSLLEKIRGKNFQYAVPIRKIDFFNKKEIQIFNKKYWKFSQTKEEIAKEKIKEGKAFILIDKKFD